MTTPSCIADPIELTRHLGSLVDKRIDILRRIQEGGSISQAARATGVSYKAAWQALETLGALAGSALVEKTAGGTHGGGTQLTDTGKNVLELANRLAQARHAVLEEFALGERPKLTGLAASSLLTSMRNHIPVTVTHIARGPAMVRVTLQIDPDNQLKACVTQESSQLLGLETGLRVLALCKATAVDISRDGPDNEQGHCVAGTVIRISRAKRGGEATIRLPQGQTIVGFCRPDHGLVIGDSAHAFISAQAIVIGLLR